MNKIPEKILLKSRNDIFSVSFKESIQLGDAIGIACRELTDTYIVPQVNHLAYLLDYTSRVVTMLDLLDKQSEIDEIIYYFSSDIDQINSYLIKSLDRICEKNNLDTLVAQEYPSLFPLDIFEKHSSYSAEESIVIKNMIEQNVDLSIVLKEESGDQTLINNFKKEVFRKEDNDKFLIKRPLIFTNRDSVEFLLKTKERELYIDKNFFIRMLAYFGGNRGIKLFGHYVIEGIPENDYTIDKVYNKLVNQMEQLHEYAVDDKVKFIKEMYYVQSFVSKINVYLVHVGSLEEKEV